MGKVISVLKVYPEENFKPEELKANLEKVEGFRNAAIEDFAFGMKIVKASFVCEDSEGKDYEEIVKKVPGVSEVQIEEVGLL